MVASTTDQTPPALHQRIARGMGLVLAGLLPLIAIFAVAQGPQRLGMLVYPEQIAALMLGMSTAIVFLGRLAVTPRALQATVDGILALMGLALGVHLYIRFPILSEGSFFHPTESLIVGLVALIVVLEGVRRAIGGALLVVFGVFLVYAMFGDLVPGQLTARAQALPDILRFLGTDSTAMLGPALAIACFIVVVFVLLGQLLVVTGGTEVFTGLAATIAGKGHGNAAKVAVLASGFFGSISGSAVSNVMSTGVVTIPMMRRAGFTRQNAAAIEAVASTGGQLMPPVMGAAAFLMAEYLRMPYREIILAALIPALLFYLSVYVQIDFSARKNKLAILADIEERPVRTILMQSWVIAVPFGVLLFGMFSLNQPAELAALSGGLSLMLLTIVFGGAKGRVGLRAWVQAFTNTGRVVGEVILITAIAGMIIGLLATTGLGFALSMALLDFGRSSLFMLLVITAVICIILGMGLPTTGVYLLLASLAAPSLIQLGVGGIEAHMFVLYFGMLSMITPPVALAAFAGASLSGAPPMQTAIRAVRFGWIAYLLPFLFVYQPGLLMQGSWTETLAITAAAVLAIPLVTAGLIGHGLRPLQPLPRFAAIAVGLLVLLPQHTMTGALLIEIVAFFAGIVMVALHVARSRREDEAMADAHSDPAVLE